MGGFTRALFTASPRLWLFLSLALKTQKQQKAGRGKMVRIKLWRRETEWNKAPKQRDREKSSWNLVLQEVGERRSRSASTTFVPISKQVITARTLSRLFTSPSPSGASNPTDHTVLLVAAGQEAGREGELFQSHLVILDCWKTLKCGTPLALQPTWKALCPSQRCSTLPICIFYGVWGKHLQLFHPTPQRGTRGSGHSYYGWVPSTSREVSSLLPSCRVRISEKAGGRKSH